MHKEDRDLKLLGERHNPRCPWQQQAPIFRKGPQALPENAAPSISVQSQEFDEMRLKTMLTAITFILIGASAQAAESTPETLPSAPPPPAGAPQQQGKALSEISLADWNQDDWMLLKPQVSLLELDGYFRFRASAFRRLDLANDSRWGPKTHSYPAKSDGKADFTGTNMRLRIEPRINVANDIRVITTIDVFDNLVLGSTPVSYSGHQDSPVDILSTSQSATTDMIQVKRAYAVVTALNEQLELRFGRMPNHWGLGMLNNSGDCLNCDYGDVVDRIAATFKIADHLFSPIYTWRASGPTFHPYGMPESQALDAYTWDDVEDFSLRVLRIDHEEDILDQVSQGETVLNYGVLSSVRQQARGLNKTFYYDDTELGSSETRYENILSTDSDYGERRDGFLYTGDAFLKLYTGKIEFAMEAALIYGSFQDTAISGTAVDDPLAAQGSPQETSVLQVGGAMELAYKFDGEYQGSSVMLKAGGASGDSAPGFGALNAADSQRRPTAQGIEADSNLQNFQFSPDYHVDLLLFRQMVGTVTDAWYLKPELAYQFDNQLLGSLSAIYSQAMFKRSTAGCYGDEGNICDGDERKGSLPMGLEFDAMLAYNSDKTPGGGGFGGAVVGGILFPLSGFDNLNKEDKNDQAGSFAWTVQANLNITF